VTPPRKNGQPGKATLMGAGVRNEALKACHRLGYAICKPWSGDHRTSLVETKRHGLKRRGERVMACTFERQVVELQVQVQVQVALLNRFTQLGRPTMVPLAAMAWLRLGLGSSRCAFDLCNKAGLRWSKMRTEQAAFRSTVFAACGGCCVVSGTAVPQALEAAHLQGRSWHGGHNAASDGVLLRRDLHALYDSSLLSIEDDGRVVFHKDVAPHCLEFVGRVISEKAFSMQKRQPQA
jgi:hypothetical protein